MPFSSLPPTAACRRMISLAALRVLRFLLPARATYLSYHLPRRLPPRVQTMFVVHLR